MGVSQKVRHRFRRFLQRPGHTVDLGPLQWRLPEIEDLEEELQALDDEQLLETSPLYRELATHQLLVS